MTSIGVAKRLSSCAHELSTCSVEDVARAAQSMVALRQEPQQLMEATEQVGMGRDGKSIESRERLKSIELSV